MHSKNISDATSWNIFPHCFVLPIEDCSLLFFASSPWPFLEKWVISIVNELQFCRQLSYGRYSFKRIFSAHIPTWMLFDIQKQTKIVNQKRLTIYHQNKGFCSYNWPALKRETCKFDQYVQCSLHICPPIHTPFCLKTVRGGF